MTKIISNNRKEVLEWLKEFDEENKRRNEIISEMTTNTDYIDWIKYFTDLTNGFYNNDCVYYQILMNEKDEVNVQNLGLFYTAINRYAQKNYIYPTNSMYGDYYKIKYNEDAFEIGISEKEGDVEYFCGPTIIDEKDVSIDFNDIMTNKKQDNVDKINATLDFLSSMIDTAYDSGVPLVEISKTLHNKVDELRNKKDKQKTLVMKK